MIDIKICGLLLMDMGSVSKLPFYGNDLGLKVEEGASTQSK